MTCAAMHACSLEGTLLANLGSPRKLPIKYRQADRELIHWYCDLGIWQCDCYSHQYATKLANYVQYIMIMTTSDLLLLNILQNIKPLLNLMYSILTC